MTSEPFLDVACINQAVAGKCLSFYGVVRDSVYAESRPKLDLKDIVEDDRWRYEELPRALESTESLSKAQLARLVKWKM